MKKKIQFWNIKKTHGGVFADVFNGHLSFKILDDKYNREETARVMQCKESELELVELVLEIRRIKDGNRGYRKCMH